MTDCGELSHSEKFIQILLSRLRDCQGRVGRKFVRERGKEDKTPSSGFDRTTALMNLAAVAATFLFLILTSH